MSAKGCYHQPCLGYQPAVVDVQSTTILGYHSTIFGCLSTILGCLSTIFRYQSTFLWMLVNNLLASKQYCLATSKVLLTANELGQEISTLPNMVILPMIHDDLILMGYRV